ncbi:MAG: hypothetical protein HC916_10920 [Coleofasciculaceae cyanobacterium SM2_1_6]|nr:hypothetical protein [Coleofasciculaceae cyanobacterium SM2_1_6]
MIVLTATCKNGVLELEQPLPTELEGEKLRIEVFFTSRDNLEIKRDKRQQFIEWSKSLSGKLPVDYKFDREEIYSDRVKL